MWLAEVADSLKRLDGGTVTGAVDRAPLGRAQTPQGARRELLLDAFRVHGDGPEVFGDEAELLARAGHAVRAVEGDERNFKITVAADLELARALVGQDGASVRQAMGGDSHPFGPQDGLRLGGIEIPEAPRLAEIGRAHV